MRQDKEPELNSGEMTISTRRSAEITMYQKRQSQYGTNRAARRAFESDERKGRL